MIQQKKAYGRCIDSLVMFQAELEKEIALMYADFSAIPVEVRDMMQDMGLRMNAFRSAYKKLINAQFDHCIRMFGEDRDG